MKIHLVSKLFLVISFFASSSFPQSPAEWQRHRLECLRHLGPQSAAIFAAAEVYNRNGDVEHEYRQSSNFYYLSGCPEPESRLILSAAGIALPGDTARYHEILFVQPRDPRTEVWNGQRLGADGARTTLGIAAALTLDQFDNLAQQALQGIDTLFVETRRLAKEDIAAEVGKYLKLPAERLTTLIFAHAGKILAPLRTVKSSEELQALRKAIDITCAAHREVMRSARSGMFEYELEALLEYVFRKNGSERLGFPSIVGSGPNSCILHYETNNRQTQNGEVVVLDIGAEYAMYTADVTRTIPINGKFSKEQAEIYNIVLAAQEAGIAATRPGAKFGEPGAAALRVVVEGLVKLGLLQGNVDEIIKTQAHRAFLMHGISHYIGLDVHDVGTYGMLAPGQVITVEPGIYISEATGKAKGIDPKYWNIGVRIEDDVLVTAEGNELLSASAPRTIQDIEALMAQPGMVDATSK